MRPTKDTYFSVLADVVSTRSTCLRRQHGAVLVKNGAIVSTGYNGSACSLPNCADGGTCDREAKGAKPGEHYEWCVAVHAEANAIVQAARHGVATGGATLYITGPPCLMCSRVIVNAGIVEVVFRTDRRYNPEESLALLETAGVKVREL